MPPPSTALSAIRHRISVYRHYFLSWATDNGETLHLIAELGIFLTKMLSITKPCLPAATREIIWYPLMALAALELALRSRIGWRSMVLFAMVHAAGLWWAVRLGSGMCVERTLDGAWRWSDEAEGREVKP
jgi:hypothetical protein